MCAIRGGDFGNQFSVFFLHLCDAHTLVSCLIAEFFNSEHKTADKSELKVLKFTKRGKCSEIKTF